MKKQKTKFGMDVSIFMAETGMTAGELAVNAGVKRTTLMAVMTGKTAGHDLIPAVCGYMDRYRKGVAAG